MSVPGVVFGQTMGRSRVNLIAYEERQAETQMSSRPKNATEQIGRASCRERVYVLV